MGLDGRYHATLLELPTFLPVSRIEDGTVHIAPYHPRPVWAVVPEVGVLWGISDRYSLELRTWRSEVLDTVALPVQARPIDAETARTLRATLVPKGAESRIVVDLPSHLPVIRRIIVGQRGRIFVLRGEGLVADTPADPSSPSGAGADAEVWDLFRRDRAYEGTIRFPAADRLTAVTSSHFVVVQSDVLGQTSVVAYRIPAEER